MASSPKRTQMSKRRDGSPTICDEEDSVANVNKHVGKSSSSRSTKIKRDKSKSRSKDKRKEDTTLEEANFATSEQENSTQVTFMEGNQMIQMTVNRNQADDELEVTNRNNQFEMDRSSGINNNATRVIEEGEIPDDSSEVTFNRHNFKRSTERSTGLSNNQRPQVVMTSEMFEEVRGQVVDEAVTKVQDLIKNSGILETASLIKKHFGEQGKIHTMTNSGVETDENKDESQSEITIYHNAVVNETVKRVSTSSEDETPNNTSDEQPMEVDNYDNDDEEFMGSACDGIFSEQKKDTTREVTRTKDLKDDKKKETRAPIDQERPSTSTGRTHDTNKYDYKTPEEIAERMVKEAESAKIRVLQPPGNEFNIQSALIDEEYMHLTSHVDENIQQKIQKGEFVDLAKLLPRDRVISEEDQRMNLVMRDGKSFWVPVNEVTAITNFARWQQAFRVYTDIFARSNPFRSAELIQYTHVIHTISQQFSWDNVYMYDKDFRLHMHRHPKRNWGMILQQAWSLRLREHSRNIANVGGNSHGYSHRENSSNRSRGHTGYNNRESFNNNDACRKFNQGKCNYGLRCKYEHKCSYCFKFGHAIIRCRKLIHDRGENPTTSSPAKNNAGHHIHVPDKA